MSKANIKLAIIVDDKQHSVCAHDCPHIRHESRDGHDYALCRVHKSRSVHGGRDNKLRSTRGHCGGPYRRMPKCMAGEIDPPIDKQLALDTLRSHMFAGMTTDELLFHLLATLSDFN